MQLIFERSPTGLLPAIIQDASTGAVLMLGYMNIESYQKTVSEQRVTFFSRSKQRLWTKGETSGHYLTVTEIKTDCDGDAILIKVKPHGPVCHTGSESCFGESTSNGYVLTALEQVIISRQQSEDPSSYTSSLFKEGLNRIAQKVGEEAVELVIASKDEDRKIFLEEAADLLFHFLILLHAKGAQFADVLDVLAYRSSKTE